MGGLFQGGTVSKKSSISLHYITDLTVRIMAAADNSLKRNNEQIGTNKVGTNKTRVVNFAIIIAINCQLQFRYAALQIFKKYIKKKHI